MVSGHVTNSNAQTVAAAMSLLGPALSQWLAAASGGPPPPRAAAAGSGLAPYADGDALGAVLARCGTHGVTRGAGLSSIVAALNASVVCSPPLLTPRGA